MLRICCTKIHAAAISAFGIALGGCAHETKFEFDELDLIPAQEELTEFSLGEYKVPIPVADNQDRRKPKHRNHMQFDFELHALVSPEKQPQIEDAWERHEGEIRDHVIRVCRTATVDELQEPELATLKARLIDALAAQMGQRELRQLLITEVVSQKL